MSARAAACIALALAAFGCRDVGLVGEGSACPDGCPDAAIDDDPSGSDEGEGGGGHDDDEEHESEDSPEDEDHSGEGSSDDDPRS